MRLHEQTMHVYAFGDEPYLSTVVARCTELGMTPVKDAPMWRDNAAPGPVEAIKYDTGSRSAVVVCRTGADWPQLRDTWGDAGEQERLAEVHLYYAVYRGPRRSWQTVRAAVAAVLGEAPPQRMTAPAAGCFLWERLGSGDRTFVLVGPAGTVDRMDGWVWPAGPIAPVPAFLWQAARLRHEESQFTAARDDVRKRQAVVTAHVAALLAEQPSHASGEESLRKLQWDTAKAAADEARLRTQAVTVDAIIHNMHSALAGLPIVDGPFGADLELGRWLAAEIADEADGSRNAVAFAEPITRATLADNAVKLRRLSERTEHLMAVQAAAIGALLVVLTVVQSISYKWPTAESLKLPFIVVLGLVALVVPIWAGRRPTAENPGRQLPRWLPIPAAALAAAAAWLAATAASLLTTNHPAPVLACAGAAALAAVLSAATTRLRRRHLPKV